MNEESLQGSVGRMNRQLEVKNSQQCQLKPQYLVSRLLAVLLQITDELSE